MIPLQGEIDGMGLNLKMGPDGTISVGPSREREEREDRRPVDREDRRGPEDEGAPEDEN
jgi:penicillin-binding protein 1A